jgi:hypothetical protein
LKPLKNEEIDTIAGRLEKYDRTKHNDKSGSYIDHHLENNNQITNNDNVNQNNNNDSEKSIKFTNIFNSNNMRKMDSR